MEYTFSVYVFASLAEQLGASALLLQTTKDEMTAEELKQQLAEAHPEAADLLQLSFVAKNQAYAEPTDLVTCKDEIALIPPVSGGDSGNSDSKDDADNVGNEDDAAAANFEITTTAISIEAVAAKVIHPANGATLTFIGTTREWTHGKQTIHLEYDAYIPMARRMLQQIGEEISSRWPGILTAITHRIGAVALAEASVVIAVSAPHREACYEASRYAIERLKELVPIWKKEIWADGSEWVGTQKGPWNPLIVKEL